MGPIMKIRSIGYLWRAKNSYMFTNEPLISSGSWEIYKNFVTVDVPFIIDWVSKVYTGSLIFYVFFYTLGHHKSWSKPLDIFIRSCTTKGPNFSRWIIINVEIFTKNDRHLYIPFFISMAPKCKIQTGNSFYKPKQNSDVKFQYLNPNGF